jgi:hypothetical protein
VSTCGLWQTTQRLVAVIVDDEGTSKKPITAPATPHNARHLLDYLATARISTLVLSEQHHRLLDHSAGLTLDIRLVPHDLLDGIRIATGLHRKSAHHTACLLARWTLTPTLRLHLRPYRAPLPRKEQLTLF